jgi:hypothetical protein
MKNHNSIFCDLLCGADSDICSRKGTAGRLEWRFFDNMLFIGGTGDMPDYTAASPAPWYPCRNSINSIIVGNGVTSIGSWAFAHCVNLNFITIPDSVTAIGNTAFFRCGSMTSVVIPDSVIYIGHSAFLQCAGLESITVPDSVISIGHSAFSGCNGMTSVTIGRSANSIGNMAFYNCRNLTAINVAAGNPAYSSVDGILFNGNRTALLACPCGKRGFYTAPSSVTDIGSHAFSHCRNIVSVTIPVSTTTIGAFAFSQCAGLTVITDMAKTPQKVDTEAFVGVDKSGCTLRVPVGALSRYRVARTWADFVTVKAAHSSRCTLRRTRSAACL